MMTKLVHISYARIYRVGGVTFEWNDYLGPYIINRHTDKERNYNNISMRNWAQVNKFHHMSKDEREQYRLI